MTREDMVTVQVKGGGGASFAAGEKYALSLAAGETAERWANGQPITRAEFDTILAPEGIFEVVALPKKATGPPTRTKE